MVVRNETILNEVCYQLTLAPCTSKVRVISRPIPLAPPVTTATAPSVFIFATNRLRKKSEAQVEQPASQMIHTNRMP